MGGGEGGICMHSCLYVFLFDCVLVFLFVGL